MLSQELVEGVFRLFANAHLWLLKLPQGKFGHYDTARQFNADLDNLVLYRPNRTFAYYVVS